MKRFWVSWWSGNYADEGCTAPLFQFWVSGQKDRLDSDKTGKDDCSLCAVIDAENEAEIWKSIHKHFPDNVPRFCNEVEKDYKPSERFLNFKNKTSLN